jgi:hypothetical protein
VRSIAVDLDKPRLTATLHAEGRPRVVRIDAGPALTRLLAATPDVAAYLAHATRHALAAREGSVDGPRVGGEGEATGQGAGAGPARG